MIVSAFPLNGHGQDPLLRYHNGTTKWPERTLEKPFVLEARMDPHDPWFILGHLLASIYPNLVHAGSTNRPGSEFVPFHFTEEGVDLLDDIVLGREEQIGLKGQHNGDGTIRQCPPRREWPNSVKAQLGAWYLHNREEGAAQDISEQRVDGAISSLKEIFGLPALPPSVNIISNLLKEKI